MSAIANESQAGNRLAWAILALVLLGMVIRLGVWQIYQPVITDDTVTYFKAAREIATLEFGGYLGRRTPIYPLLILAGQSNYAIVWFLQSCLGIGISVVIFFIVLECVPSRRLAFALALLHSLTLNQLLFEATMLSETLSTLLVLVSVLAFLRVLKGRGGHLFLLLGISSALATLARPLYIYLGPFYLLLLVVARRTPDRKAVVAYILAFSLPILAWAAFNKVQIGYFGLSSQMGLSLSQHSGKFIDKAPEEFATLRDIYLKHRAQMPPDADHMSIWEAVPDMLSSTGLRFVDLNRQLTRLSLLLFARYPELYLRSAFGSWITFWAVPNPWHPEFVQSAGLRHALESIWSVERFVLRGFNLLFVVLAACLAPVALVMAAKARRVSPQVAIGGVVLAASIVQALLEATDNARYSIPTQPLVIIFVVTIAFSYLQARSSAWHDGRRIQARDSQFS